MLIRLAGEEDVLQLVRLNGIVQRMHVDGRPSVFKEPAPGEVEAWFNGLIGNGPGRIWVAADETRVLGYAGVIRLDRPGHLFCHARKYWEIDQISVLPESRRRGVATALLRHIATQARSEGITEIRLSSWVFNQDAHETWRKLGFRAQIIRYAISPEQLNGVIGAEGDRDLSTQ